MESYPQSFEVYGFTIEVHAGGRCIWPPSFKRFIKQKLDCGEFTVGDVMNACNVSQSLVYKWRANVERAAGGRTVQREERIFSEIVIEEHQHVKLDQRSSGQIVLRGKEIEISLPEAYSVDDLVTVILALEGRT